MIEISCNGCRTAMVYRRQAYATDGAAGLDVVAAEDLTLAPGQRHAVATGFAIAIPPGYEVQVRPRSGLALKHGITCLNTPGTIDEDYRGEVKVILANLGAEPFEVRRGERIAQLVPAPVTKAAFPRGRGAERDRPRGRGLRLDRASEPLATTSSSATRGTSSCRRSAASGSASSRTRRSRSSAPAGIGSAVIPALAGAGVGQLTIIDDDVVELANLHRQPLFRERDAGYSKADLALQFVQRLNRFVNARPVQQRIDAGNARRPARRPRPGHRRQRQFRDPARGQRRLRRARHSAGLGGRGAVPGAGRPVPREALLPLLRRRRVRCRGLRQLRRARRARRADRDGGQLRGAAGDQRASSASATTRRARFICSMARSSAGGRSRSRRIAPAGRAAQPKASAIRSISRRATSSFDSSGQSSTPVGGDQVDAVAVPAHDVAGHVIGDDPVGALWRFAWRSPARRRARFPPRSRSAVAAAARLRPARRGCRGSARSSAAAARRSS